MSSGGLFFCGVQNKAPRGASQFLVLIRPFLGLSPLTQVAEDLGSQGMQLYNRPLKP